MDQIDIEVVYARLNGEIFKRELRLSVGSIIWDAIIASGVLEQCPELLTTRDDLSENNLSEHERIDDLVSSHQTLLSTKSKLSQRIGIYGCLHSPDKILENQDRIEIYRPLLLEPKEARRIRAARTVKPFKPKGRWKSARVYRS